MSGTDVFEVDLAAIERLDQIAAELDQLADRLPPDVRQQIARAACEMRERVRDYGFRAWLRSTGREFPDLSRGDE